MKRPGTGLEHGACAMLGLILVVALTVGCDDKVEKTIGDMTSRSIEREYKVVDDPLLSEWISVMGHTMLGYSGRQDIPYSFKILDSDMVNAFAAPYGYIYVTTGLLDFAESEDEVWTVVGHEIGHVVHRHSLSAVKRGLLYNLGLALLGGKSRSLAEVAGVGLGLLSLHYSRENEYEADDMGRVLTYAAGYDPRGTADFFDRLKERYEKDGVSRLDLMFRTHPPSQSRAGRQRSMPELSGNSPDALLKIGRGYARRFEMRRAEEHLARAAELRPQDLTVMLSLADTQLLRGKYHTARALYEKAGRLRPESRYVAEGLRLASAGEPTLPLASADERRQAQAYNDEARQVASLAEQAGRDIQARTISLDTSFAPSVRGTRSIIADLMGLRQSETELSESLQGVVTYANAAVNRAIEPVYSVEQQQERLRLAAQQLTAASKRLANEMDRAAAGTLPQGDVAVLERTLRETRRGLEEIRTALDELARAEPAVRAAQEAARDSTRLVSEILKGDTSSAAADRARRAAQLTESRALTALAATRKSKQLADRASVRALVSRINLAGVGASAAARRNMDGLVAYYTFQRPQVVAQLRGESLGYGDAALLLTSARSTRLDLQEFTGLARSAHSIVDQLSSAGARTDGALVLLKYLASAAEYESGE